MLTLLCTNPANLPSVVLMLPFVLLFVSIFLGLVTLCGKSGLRLPKALRIGAVLAGLPTALLVLQSIGQLTVRDLITILAFFVICYFYVSRIAAATF